MKISWKNIENWRSWKMRFFWVGHFEFFFASSQWKKQTFHMRYHFFSTLWMVFPESWKRSCPNFYAHDCTSVWRSKNSLTIQEIKLYSFICKKNLKHMHSLFQPICKYLFLFNISTYNLGIENRNKESKYLHILSRKMARYLLY